MESILRKLKGGDRRSVGRVNEVVADVLRKPAKLHVLFEGLRQEDPILRMRCADAIEKITAKRPELLRPYKARLIREVAKIDQQEVRWHVAQLIPRLELSPEDRSVAWDILLSYLQDDSKIVRTFSLQALAELAENHVNLLPQVIEILEAHTSSGSAAVRSRGRRLLKKLRHLR